MGYQDNYLGPKWGPYVKLISRQGPLPELAEAPLCHIMNYYVCPGDSCPCEWIRVLPCQGKTS